MSQGGDDLFDGSRLKLKRANQHIADLSTLLTSFVDSKPYTVDLQDDLDRGEQVLKFAMLKDVPCDTPLIIGDALHNIRTALDFAAAELVRRADNGRTSKFIKFPFRSTREELEAAVKGGDIKVAHPTIIDAIVNEVRPYEGGNMALVGLHNLDITDKHHLLIPIVTVSGITGDFHINGRLAMRQCTIISSANKHNMIGLPKGQDLQGNYRVILDVTFQDGLGFDGQPVVPTLHQLSKLTSSVLDILSNAFVSSRT